MPARRSSRPPFRPAKPNPQRVAEQTFFATERPRPNLVRIDPHVTDARPEFGVGDWVTIESGLYTGDVARIVELRTLGGSLPAARVQTEHERERIVRLADLERIEA